MQTLASEGKEETCEKRGKNYNLQPEESAGKTETRGEGGKNHKPWKRREKLRKTISRGKRATGETAT